MSVKQYFAFWLAVMLLCAAIAPAVLAEGTTPDSGHSNSNDSGSSGTTNDDLLSPDTSVVVLTSFDKPDRMDAVAFATGTPREELSTWFSYVVYGFTGYDAFGNYYDLTSGACVLETVDTSTPGLYYAYVVPDLGKDYRLADGVSLPKQLCAVSIQTPGKPDINCCLSARGFLHFPWVLSTKQQEQLGNFEVSLRKDSGPWTKLTEGFTFTSDDLQLSQRIFEQGSNYNLQVSYPGGRTGILTFQYDGELLISDYSEGDRDGGDTDGTDSPSSSQPAPESSDSDDTSSTGNINHEKGLETGSLDKTSTHIAVRTPVASIVAPLPQTSPSNSVISSAPPPIDAGIHNPSTNQSFVQKLEPPVMESYSPTETVISGLRLRDLCADQESVVFGEGDLTISIPSDILLALDLDNTETLSVKLTQPEETLLVVAVTAAGQTVTSLPGTVLRLRYHPLTENSLITVLDESQNAIANTEFDDEFLRFPIEAAGTYLIEDAVPASVQTSGGQRAKVLIPLAASCLLLAIGGKVVMVWRRRHA